MTALYTAVLPPPASRESAYQDDSAGQAGGANHRLSGMFRVENLPVEPEESVEEPAHHEEAAMIDPPR